MTAVLTPPAIDDATRREFLAGGLSLAGAGPGRPGLAGGRGGGGQLLSQFGLSLPPAVTALPGELGAQISLEQLGTLDADVLIMSYTSDDLRTSLENNPVFQAVPAVRNGHYLPLRVDSISALILPSVLSIPYGLDQLEPGLGKVLK